MSVEGAPNFFEVQVERSATIVCREDSSQFHHLKSELLQREVKNATNLISRLKVRCD
jgi:hypothetical protein